MDWWQIALIILASVVVGLLVGGLVSYLITRILKKPFIKGREVPARVGERAKYTEPGLVTEAEHNSVIPLFKKPFAKEHEVPAGVEEKVYPLPSR